MDNGRDWSGVEGKNCAECGVNRGRLGLEEEKNRNLQTKFGVNELRKTVTIAEKDQGREGKEESEGKGNNIK